MILGCVNIEEENFAGTSATGNNGVIVGDVQENSYVQRILADNEVSNGDVSIHLYRKDDPYTIQKTTQLNEENQFRFEGLDYATYIVRVDVGEDKGGIKENIVIENAEVVYINIEINIYITNIVNNFYFDGEKAEVKDILSYYGGTQLVTNTDGSFTIKTLPGTSENSLLVTQNNDSLELGIKEEAGTLLVTPKSEQLEIIQSSETLSSSSPINFDSLEIRFEGSNAKDAWNTDGAFFADHNGGGSKISRMAKYDNSARSRTLIQIVVPEILIDKPIVDAKIELTVCEVANKLGGEKNTVIHTHTILKSWDEGKGSTSNGEKNISIVEKGVSATNRRPGEPWGVFAIGLNDDDASASIYSVNEYSWLSPSSLNLGRKFSVDITEAIREWVAFPLTNFGILLKAADESEDNSTIPNMYFTCSKEADNPADRPLLKVIYEK